MRISTQVEVHNKRETEKMLSESRKAYFSTRPGITEAATMAGEMIARINNGKKTTSEEVIRTYRPGYLKKRGGI
jgi:hypothetical protein